MIQVVSTAGAGDIWMHKLDSSNIHYLECRLPPKIAEPPDVDIANGVLRFTAERHVRSSLDDYTACEGVNE